ncbi:glycosyltransferase family 25 protein [Nitratireductor aquimarinus]|uniref:glycosyltransferase family 25 protein n=1 Tax=Nitratireductor TaxID=245876 RepID=UPI0019D33419|nr:MULTISPECIES: glycosyltransferase family 25 protein [Nitratireductor]MBN7776088.1 glycosyltransferase family 25 protein [Nitratireductor pacificus]MBN7780752.1 glycosyltransferase family 25 protein [Nitratireductor pacificus]MBN7789558.1 glycosyltransferase family 25 protein [Nitratireductor aquimarinus]MBY6098836.1 glycosyltransferase family 25 protein [Nitratireductor aquimarinus]MCA1261705.1 glycosyltransferase family 25 protein [Nitratireductor aquimarinus]
MAVKIRAYVIHLQRASNRQENVQKLKESLPVPTTIIPAIDSQTVTSAILEQYVQRQVHTPRYPFPLNTNEVACFLSHRAAWSAIVSDNVDAGLVLEDDALTTSDFIGAFDFARCAMREGHLIRFPHRDDCEDGTFLLRDGRYQLLEPVPVGLGMVAQLITRDAAIRLLAKTEQFDRPVDTFAQMYWITGVRPYSVRPSGIQEISAALGGSLLKQSKSLSAKFRHEILRPIYRRKIRSLSS